MEAEADAIISKAEGSDVAGLYKGAVEYLRPLHGLLGFEGKENAVKTTAQIHGMAKRFVSFLGTLLKVSCNNLTKGISETDGLSQRRADELFRTLKLALDSFDALRPCLVGSPHEIEVQRYWMVRRLMAWKRFREAREECWITLRSLRVNVLSCTKKEVPASARKKNVVASTRKTDVTASVRRRKEKEKNINDDRLNLYGEQAESADQGLVVLVVGLVTDLIICTGESRLTDVEEYGKVLLLIEQLSPWQRVSDKNTIEKHRSMLFKGLHKCALFMAMEPSHFDPKLTDTFCLLALSNCACSSVKDQFLKITRGICHQLLSGSFELSSLVGNICKFALSTIFKDKQWQLYREHEIIDVIELYCRQCENNCKLTNDAKQFLHEIANVIGKGSSFSLPSVLHIYGIGLGFKNTELRNLCNDGAIYIDCEASEIPEVQSCAENNDAVLLCNLVQTIQNIVEKVQQTFGTSESAINGYRGPSCGTKCNASELSNGDHIQRGGTLISIFKALEFLWKVSAGYVHQEWDFFVANSTTTGPSAWHSSLEQAFLIFTRVFVSVQGCNIIPLNERKELLKSSQTVLLAGTAALRLSLMRLECSQDNFEIMNNLLSGDWVQFQELKWLVSCTYNIGVKMFNNKQFDLACNPLKLAYRAAWRRVSLALSGLPDELVEFGRGSGSSEGMSELVSNACATSIVLVDVLHRSESPAAKEIITDFLMRWSSADSNLSDLSTLRALAKLWVKMVFADYKEVDMDELSVEGLTLHKFLSDSGCLLPAAMLGALLEEELLAFTKIETDLSRLIQKRIRKFLLEDVYVAKEFSLERSRVILEQCKAVRLTGAKGLDRCMDCLADAISILRNVLDEDCSLHGTSYRIDCVRHQLAITYCVHAFCTQELNANSEVIRDDITSAVKLWSCMYSSKRLDLDEEQKDWFETSIPLLLNVSQLLALKGFICLQSEVQEMILHILRVLKKLGPEESCAVLWRESSLSHPLCCIPFSEQILSILTNKFGICVNSIKFWESCVNDNLGSTLGFQQKLMYDLFIKAQADRDLATNSSFSSLRSIELLKESALTIVSNGQKTGQSAYLASHLFYILSEKCLQNGQILEALKYSKEALLIRRKQLRRTYKILDKKEIQFSCRNNDGQKREPTEMKGISMEVLASVATNVWPNFADCKKQTENGPCQWTILGNYLESLMQVGVIYEMVGAASDAEYIFLEGLNISNAQNLPLGQASFGSCLGEIYRKCHNWDMAAKNLEDAMQVFCLPDMEHVCKLCKATIEAMLEMRMGDLVRRCPEDKKHVYLPKNLTSDVDIYMSAKEKLNAIARSCTDNMPLNRNMHSEEDCGCNPHASQEVNAESRPKLGSCNRNLKKKSPFPVDSRLSKDLNFRDVDELCKEMSRSHLGESLAYADNGSTENREAAQKGRKATRKVDLDSSSIGMKDCKGCKELQKGQTGYFNAPSSGSQEASHLKECLAYYVSKKKKTDSMQELIAFNLECHRRSLLSRLLLQIGKCYEASEEFLKAHEIFMQNISLLFFHSDRLPCLCSFVNEHHCQLKCHGRSIVVDVLLIERAALLYHISWFSVRKNLPAISWMQCCSFAENRKSFVIEWLNHAFFICSQMPPLLRKVSILLAIVHMPLSSGPLPEGHHSNLSASHWSAYFHQASLGTRLRHEHLAVLDSKLASLDFDTNKVSHRLNSKDLIKSIQQALRLIPDNPDELESFVEDFFKCLPLPSIVCISLLDSKYASVLEEQSFMKSSSAWIFISRFDSNGPPVVLLLPIRSTFEGIRKDGAEGGNLCSPYTLMNMEDEYLEGDDLGSSSEVNKWINSPSQTVVDVIAEEFGLVLEESHISTSNTSPATSNEDKNRWWQWRMQLDRRLGDLLRGIEESWLGPWKCLLLGEPLEAAYREALNRHMQDLQSSIDSSVLNLDMVDRCCVDASLLKVFLGGISTLTNNEIEKAVSYLVSRTNLEHTQSPSSPTLTVNGKIAMGNSFLSHSIYEGSQFHKIIGKAAKELTNMFENLATRKNGYCNMHDTEPRTSSKQRKKHVTEDNKEFRLSQSSIPCNLSNNLGKSDTICIAREPVVLVLDANSQVLPWESLPILRKQEVYRMPSVGSILALMICRGQVDLMDMFDVKKNEISKRKNNTNQEISARKSVSCVPLEQRPKLPVVDPYNAFYLLNPSGDLGTTQAAFEDWFKSQEGWEGKTGVIPTPEECILALQQHDLFIYFGHGNGGQYIPERNIKRLDYCAAAVLMGCSSGSLSCRGDYEPVGVPLSYLMAGCPSIIANLWDVTDGDIDRFSRVLLSSWLEGKSGHGSELEVLEEFENLTISSRKVGRKALRPRQKGKNVKDQDLRCQQSLSGSVLDASVDLKPKRGAVRTASCISEGRGACKLPYLIGASPVCYGVPTTIKHK